MARTAASWALVAALFLLAGAAGGAAYLVRDINDAHDPSSAPGGFTRSGDHVFFSTHGSVTRLWRTDGTAAGTTSFLTLDRGAYLNGSLVAVDGGVVFTACTSAGTGRCDVWRSDGTDGGTTRLATFSSWVRVPSALAVAGTLYLVADHYGLHDLWRSDGTAAGTVRLASFHTGSAWSDVSALARVGDGVFFAGCDLVDGCRLWKSDGTATGTVPVALVIPPALMNEDDEPDPWQANLFDLTAVGDAVFFATCSWYGRCDLCKSDGTADGTSVLIPFGPAEASDDGWQLPHFVAANGLLLFTSFPHRRGGELAMGLWSTDGTQAGTQRLAEIHGIDGPAVVDAGGTVYFDGCDATAGCEVWRSDGTRAGTSVLKDVQPGPESSEPFPLALTDDGRLFFVTTDVGATRRLWVSDGTTDGTQPVGDVLPGSSLGALGQIVLFSACTPADGCELWRSDGTPAGTAFVADLDEGTGHGRPRELAALDDLVFFSAYTPGTGDELWRSDGTAAGTLLVRDIVPGDRGSSPRELTRVGSQMFFVASDREGGRALWRSDGTEAGTMRVATINTDPADRFLTSLTVVGNTLFFVAAEPATGHELWKVDGADHTAVLVRDILPGPTSSAPALLTSFEGALYFVLYGFGNDLWRSDGTAAGTWPVASGLPAWPHGEVGGIVAGRRTMLLTTRDWQTPPYGRSVLWGSDGTTAGTTPLLEMYGRPLADVNGTFFFARYGGTSSSSLWKTDGTPTGTTQVAVIMQDFDGVTGSAIENAVAVDGALFFQAGGYLWRSDGTEAGTVRVARTGVGVSASFWTGLGAVVAGTRFFVPVWGAERDIFLWTSDGTAGGTRVVATAGRPAVRGNLAHAGGRLFFTGYTPEYGEELWALPLCDDDTSACDDGDPCTGDRCDGDGGCIHDRTASCPSTTTTSTSSTTSEPPSTTSSSSTTILPRTTTTTTTMPANACPPAGLYGVRCLLDAAARAIDACATPSRHAKRDLRVARRLVEAATTSPRVRARRLVQHALVPLGRAIRAADDETPGCAADGSALREARNRAVTWAYPNASPPSLGSQTMPAHRLYPSPSAEFTLSATVGVAWQAAQFTDDHAQPLHVPRNA